MAPKSGVEVHDYPKKLFYKINEVASITGLEAYVLRYWEGKFPMLAPEKDDNDQRRYRQKDIEMLFYIKKLLYEDKYTIAGAVEVLKQEKSGRRRRKGRKGAKGAAEADQAGDSLAAEEAEEYEADATGKDGGIDPTRLGEIRKQVAGIRKNVRGLVADLKKWRSTIETGS